MATPPRKVTLTNSPRTPSRSPTRGQQDEQNIVLAQVIGTTISDSNGLDCLPSARCFAYTAGSAAILAHVDLQLKVTKRFFRAKPNCQFAHPCTPFHVSPKTAKSQTRGRSHDLPLSFPTIVNSSVESPSNRLAISRERTKAATCVALSRDGLFLAVGETGYKPRVLLFSTAKGASTDHPLTVLSEHTFGVRCLAFSPNSQYLATLGEMNDGFLYIWNVNRHGNATCVLTNKCTSNIKHMAWLGSSLVTCGTRHVKLWRIEPHQKRSPSKRLSDLNMGLASPSLKTLGGRNLLLGPQLDKTFTAIVPISELKAFVCSEKGDICLLEIMEIPRFVKVAEVDCKINAATIYNDFLVVSGDHGKIVMFELDCLLSPTKNEREPLLQPTSLIYESEILAIAPIGDSFIVSTSDRNIQVISFTSTSGSSRALEIALEFPSHSGPVQGVQCLKLPNKEGASFYTWSSEGNLFFWSFGGLMKSHVQIELDQIEGDENLINELKIVRAHPTLEFLATGDKFGVLRLMEMTTKDSKFSIKAHASEITDIVIDIQESQTTIASCGRDRMVQLFKRDGTRCELIQTLNDHVGAVNGMLFTTHGQKFVSCSSDRSIIIREAMIRTLHGESSVIYAAARTITLRATPLSMDLRYDDKYVFVSTADRSMHTYDLQSGELYSSFKTTDQDGGDAVILSSIVHSHRDMKPVLLAGVSSMDKSVRIYDENGQLLSRQYGHTEGMTGISIIEDENNCTKSLVTVATDGTIFIWNLVSDVDHTRKMLESLELDPISTRASQLLTKQPLRRILSSSELTHFQECRDEDSVSPLPSPTANRERMRHRSSRLSMVTTPQSEPSKQMTQRSSTGPLISTPELIPLSDRSSNIGRKSPFTQKFSQSTLGRTARQSLYTGTRRTSSTNDLASTYKLQSQEVDCELSAATVQICTLLQAYRSKLLLVTTEAEPVPGENFLKLQKELELTNQILTGRGDLAENFN